MRTVALPVRSVVMSRRVAVTALLLGAAACNVEGTVAPVGESPASPSKVEPNSPAPNAPTIGPLAGMRLYAAPDSPARRQADLWRATRPADAALMDRMAAQPFAKWLAEWTPDVTGAVRATVDAAAAAGTVPVLVAYNIPNRDCGLYSAGGASTASGYRAWIRNFAAGLRGTRAVVILEPDGAAAADCLPAAQQEERFALLRDAVDVLGGAGALVYVDAGNARWRGVEATAALLTRAGGDRAHGFALNVSNFVGTAESVVFGDALARRVGGKRYLIDTSRNGLGPAAGDVWCNPQGRAIGNLPTTQTGHSLADAFVWVKVPGESDGTCNGGPAAGQWWGEYALGLAKRSPFLQ